MALLLRAITQPTDLREIDDVRALDVGGLTAWISEVFTDASRTFTKRDLLDDHRLVERIFQKVDACLPVRFPTVFEDPEALHASLSARSTGLETELERVRGCCEIAVTLTWTSPEDAQAFVQQAVTPGRRYLLERQARWAGSDRRHARASELAAEIERIVGRELVEASRSVCPSPTLALSMALLVKLVDAQQVLGRLPRSAADVRILVHGPWPAYSFVGVGTGSGHGGGRGTGGAQAAASARPGSAPESDRR